MFFKPIIKELKEESDELTDITLPNAVCVEDQDEPPFVEYCHSTLLEGYSVAELSTEKLKLPAEGKITPTGLTTVGVTGAV